MPDISQAAGQIEGFVPSQVRDYGATAQRGTTYGLGAAATYNSSNKPVLTGLVGIAEQLLAPHLAEHKEALFVKGIQEAQTGRALEEIKQDQPAFTRIFGRSDVVQGARFYASVDKANRASLQVSQEMGTLRTMSPEAARSRIMEITSEHQTGDPVADKIYQQRMLQESGQTFKTLAKEQYAYGQERIKAAQESAWQTTFTKLQSMREGLANGIVREDDYQMAELDALALTQPAEGQDNKSYIDSVTSLISNYATHGNFLPWESFMKSGMFTALPQDEQAKLTKRVETEGLRFRDQYAPADLQAARQQIIDGVYLGELHLADGYKQAQELNAKYKLLTGSPVPFISVSEFESMGTGARSARKEAMAEAKREAQAALDKQDKELSEQRYYSQLAEAHRRGEFHAGNEQDNQYVAAISMNASKEVGTSYTPFGPDGKVDEAALQMLVNGSNKGFIQRDFQRQLSWVSQTGIPETINDDMVRLASMYDVIADHPGGGAKAASSYFGSSSAYFSILQQMRKQGVALDDAHHYARSQAATGAQAALTKEDQKLVKGTVKDTLDSGWFGSGKPSAATEEMVNADVLAAYKNLKAANPGMSEEALLDGAKTQIRAEHSISDKYYIRGGGQLHLEYGIDTRTMASVMESMIDSRQKSKGYSSSNNATVMMTKDGNLVYTGEYNGQSTGFEVITKKQIDAEVSARMAGDAESKRRRQQRVSDTIEKHKSVARPLTYRPK